MRKTSGKLKLQRETLSRLEAGELREAAGGKGPTAIDCSVTCRVRDQTSFGCLQDRS